MKRNYKSPRVFSLFIIFTVVFTSIEYANQSTSLIAPSLIGTWQVTKVRIDNSTRTRAIQYNDPRYMHRLLTVTANSLIMDCETECFDVKLTPERTTMKKLIQNSMGGEDPEPKDYDISIAGNTLINAFWINCKRGGFGDGCASDHVNSWFVVLPEDQLIISWYDCTILTLRRLQINAKPIASFDCTKAITPTEKTICGSISLSAFDRSIAEAYSNAVKFFTDVEEGKALKRLKEVQKAWLIKRDKCGIDQNCLKKSMIDQLEILSDTRTFLMNTEN